MGRVIDNVDVICEHKADGSIIPMRFRLSNEDGVYEAYTIKCYRQLYQKETHTTPDGILLNFEDYAMGIFAAGSVSIKINFSDYPELFTDTYNNYKNMEMPIVTDWVTESYVEKECIVLF